MKGRRVRVLVAGGFDPTCRAGVLADAAAVRESGGAPVALATLLTAQGESRFEALPVPLSLLRRQLAGVLAVGAIDAVKVGAVGARSTLRWLAQTARRLGVPLVVDPVTATSRGERLSPLRPADYLGLRGGVLTPNRAELEWLGVSAPQLLAWGFEAVVVKGGAAAVDEVWAAGAAPVALRAVPLPRSTRHHRGTGCRFASVLATWLAMGESPVGAARRAKWYIRKFLAAPIIEHSAKGRYRR